MNLDIDYEKAYRELLQQEQAGGGQLLPSNSLMELVKRWRSLFAAKEKGCSKNILVLGSGLGEMAYYLSSLNLGEVYGVDIAPSAVNYARTYHGNSQGRFPLHYLQGDVRVLIPTLMHSFDLIVDHHCFHCLCLDQERLAYFENLQKYLRPKGGQLLLESVATASDNDDGESEKILWRKRGDKFYRYRRAVTGVELEQEFLSRGFTIEYLVYRQDLCFESSFGVFQVIANRC
ncbi:MAG: class I SAM-dependent methyltransferase [Oligoflexia bacterium]|nr:class I SAM-dependent methyltransferase [Oligoflexia bacterium]